jgi:membrane-associated phospholipid phosphatase
MRPIIVLFFCLFMSANILAAGKDSLTADTLSPPAKVYNMHPKYQLPLAGVAIVASTLGFHALDANAYMSPEDVMKLNPNDINAFDRPTALHDPASFSKAAGKGDFILNFSVASPLLLALDKDIRKDWVDLLTLYLAAQAFDNMLYFTAIATVRRPRPMAYNTGLSMAERTGVGMSKSFFSGHVSFSATATFLVVKVYTDYHHIKGWPRLLMYGAAAVPPLIVGYFRVESGRHFKTDMITGLICGAASGILVPELFRNKNKEKKNLVRLTPYYMQDGGGVNLTVRL